ncbi:MULTISPECIES: hypothetical protein [unclassified Paraburkholderia]|uniref:hypothetical protein n=1 Tax=unclassified Paraburkholderia TaxID=2615204 RepID=UPI002AAFCE10|nr:MULTISPECIES: hypothetical protein [unclassified Paraburkholderia]
MTSRNKISRAKAWRLNALETALVQPLGLVMGPLPTYVLDAIALDHALRQHFKHIDWEEHLERWVNDAHSLRTTPAYLSKLKRLESQQVWHAERPWGTLAVHAAPGTCGETNRPCDSIHCTLYLKVMLEHPFMLSEHRKTPADKQWWEPAFLQPDVRLTRLLEAHAFAPPGPDALYVDEGHHLYVGSTVGVDLGSRTTAARARVVQRIAQLFSTKLDRDIGELSDDALKEHLLTHLVAAPC